MRETVTLQKFLRSQRRGDLRLAKQRWASHEKEWRVFTVYAERRWSDLNGEAGRLKTILEASVPKATFEQYVNTQRDKDDAREKAQREHLDAYVQSQATAFKKYTDDISAKLSAINTRIATFVGGGMALITVLQLWLNYGRG